jgi:hypothetical protein
MQDNLEFREDLEEEWRAIVVEKLIAGWWHCPLSTAHAQPLCVARWARSPIKTHYRSFQSLFREDLRSSLQKSISAFV